MNSKGYCAMMDFKADETIVSRRFHLEGTCVAHIS